MHPDLCSICHNKIDQLTLTCEGKDRHPVEAGHYAQARAMYNGGRVWRNEDKDSPIGIIAGFDSTVDDLFDLLIRAQKEPRISHQAGDSARGEYCVAYRNGHSWPIVRGHTLRAALKAAVSAAGLESEAQHNGE